MYRFIKRKVYIILQPEIGNTFLDKSVNIFIIILIILNVIAVMLETVPTIHQPYKSFFHYFDLTSVMIFSVEYILRVWSITENQQYRHWFWGRLKYIFSPGALIDMLAILPFYLHVFIGFDLRVLRIFRLLRFLRLFRLTAYMKATRLVINVFKSIRNELVLGLVLTMFLIIISSCLIFFAEHRMQPDKFSSIPATIWWSVVTLTTVGYGDMVPITVSGKILTSAILMIGIALFALPAGLITAGFLDEFRHRRNSKNVHTCPHCGKVIEPGDHH